MTYMSGFCLEFKTSSEACSLRSLSSAVLGRGWIFRSFQNKTLPSRAIELSSRVKDISDRHSSFAFPTPKRATVQQARQFRAWNETYFHLFSIVHHWDSDLQSLSLQSTETPPHPPWDCSSWYLEEAGLGRKRENTLGEARNKKHKKNERIWTQTEKTKQLT